MPITVVCACQKRLRAPDSLAGKRVKCPACGTELDIPQPDIPEIDIAAIPLAEPPPPEPELEYGSEVAPPRKVKRRRVPDEETPSIERYRHILDKKPVHSWRDFTYWSLLLALIPLFFYLFVKNDDPVEARFQRTIANAPPPAQQRIEKVLSDMDDGKAADDALFAELPDGRIEGAHLPRKTMIHYLYGLVAAGCYFVLGLFLLRSEDTHPWQLFLIGLFTGTFGIVFLLIAQFLAAATQGMIVFRGNVIVMVIFWVAWAIGFSYRAALDPNTGFVASFLGFTFGVGLCEEVCKALPILTYYRRPGEASWHKACTWGFSSGVGFGIAEAIMYSGNQYNGVSPLSVYLVRFVSCVTLHAIWAVSTALFIHKHPWIIQGADEWHSYIPRVVAIVSIPMVLHGLYDTALKKDLNSVALVAALVSFAWLAYCMETARDTDEVKPKKRRRARLAHS